MVGTNQQASMQYAGRRKLKSAVQGEIFLTSMETDGTKNGFDLAVTSAISEAVNIPVIVSGGVGTLSHFYDGFTKGKADACLAASVFHYGEFTVRDVKEYLNGRDIPVRL